MKKSALSALAAVVTASALALSACGGSSGGNGAADGEGKTLNVLIGANANYPEQQKQWFADTAAAFKKQTGAEVKFETFASGNEELQKIQASVVSGDGPDVYTLGTTFTPTAVSTKAFLQLGDDEWNKVGGRDKFNPATLAISGPDKDHQFGVPFASRPFVMAYNKQLLKAAGIDKPATTWDGLREQAKNLTDPAKGQYGLAVGYKDNYDPWKFIWAMSLQSGNKLVDGSTLTLDDPSVKAAYQTYFGWLSHDKTVDPASVGWTNSSALAAFASGKAAFFPMTTVTSLNTLGKSPIKDQFDYALMPLSVSDQQSAGGTQAASILSGDNIVVADYTKNKDLALAFVKMVTEKDAQLTYQKTFGDLPTNAEALKEVGSGPHLAPIADAAAKSYATPFTGAWADIQLAMVNVAVQSIPDLAAGGVSDSSLTQRLKEAQTKAQASLDRASKG